VRDCCFSATLSNLLLTDEATIPESPIEERVDEAPGKPSEVVKQQKPPSPLFIRFHYRPPTPSQEVKIETPPDPRAVRTASVWSCSSLITQELMDLDMVLGGDYEATKAAQGVSIFISLVGSGRLTFGKLTFGQSSNRTKLKLEQHSSGFFACWHALHLDFCLASTLLDSMASSFFYGQPMPPIQKRR
jgi:hypothetical protein